MVDRLLFVLVCLISACVLFHYINVFVRFVCGLMCVLCGFGVLLVCACVRVGLKLLLLCLLFVCVALYGLCVNVLSVHWFECVCVLCLSVHWVECVCVLCL